MLFMFGSLFALHVAILTDSLTVATFSEQLLNEEPDRQQAECHVLPSFLPFLAAALPIHQFRSRAWASFLNAQ